MTIPLVSPSSGKPLRADTPHSLAAAGERWPVVDGIPFLRVGREALAADALTRLDAGDGDGALAFLLSDQDDWWDGPRPELASLRDLVRDRDHLSLREAMDRLAFGRVGDYFAHRWSDPVFTAGLALVEAHWSEPETVFELACGIGQYLHALEALGTRCTGGDVVFAKLWLARHWVLGPGADLVCFDAGHPWPVADLRADLVLCQDAFYFLEPKAEILAALRRSAGPDGTLLVGHVHNREAPGFSAGRAVTAEEVGALFPGGVVYDDAELTRAAVEARPPVPGGLDRLRRVEAFSIADGPGLRRAPGPVAGRVGLPAEGAELRRNPLYPDDGAAIAWPSDRYRLEYGPRATYPERSRMPERVRYTPNLAEAARRRELVHLPERW